MSRKLLGRYARFPKDLFRISAGYKTTLRDRALRLGAPLWDVMTYGGIVEAVGAKDDWYQRPNGASMRPNTRTQQSLVRNFRAPVVLVYHVPQGITLPEDLILIHERGEHWSLQPRHDMMLDELNAEITGFLNSKANLMSREEWHIKFPVKTE